MLHRCWGWAAPSTSAQVQRISVSKRQQVAAAGCSSQISVGFRALPNPPECSYVARPNYLTFCQGCSRETCYAATAAALLNSCQWARVRPLAPGTKWAGDSRPQKMLQLYDLSSQLLPLLREQLLLHPPRFAKMVARDNFTLCLGMIFSVQFVA